MAWEQNFWKERRDKKQVAGERVIGLMCNDCHQFIEEQVPNTRIPTLVDRTCGLIYEWSSLDERWYKNDIRDWTFGREATPKGEAS